MTTQNYINHIVYVLDESGSMASLAEQVIKVADAQTEYLAQRSKDLDQETRVTVYAFNSRGTTRCLFYDKDVLRLPSLRGLYRPSGNTALVDATIKALEDLAKTPELYGDHAFLTYVVTDGQENNSSVRPDVLKSQLDRLPDNWTVACLVPDSRGVFEAKKFGFAPNNIAVWDATSNHGVVEVGRTIKDATESFMQARSFGVRSTRGLFRIDTSNVDAAKVAGQLQPLAKTQYRLIPVTQDQTIAPFVERNLGVPYSRGMAYYQISKSELVQPQKNVAIRDKYDGRLYTGADARRLLGLPDSLTRVSPSLDKRYDIFVQSTSDNRRLIAGTNLLVV